MLMATISNLVFVFLLLFQTVFPRPGNSIDGLPQRISSAVAHLILRLIQSMSATVPTLLGIAQITASMVAACFGETDIGASSNRSRDGRVLRPTTDYKIRSMTSQQLHPIWMDFCLMKAKRR